MVFFEDGPGVSDVAVLWDVMAAQLSIHLLQCFGFMNIIYVEVIDEQISLGWTGGATGQKKLWMMWVHWTLCFLFQLYEADQAQKMESMTLKERLEILER